MIVGYRSLVARLRLVVTVVALLSLGAAGAIAQPPNVEAIVAGLSGEGGGVDGAAP